MEGILLFNELWEKQRKAGANWDKYRKGEKKILSYFVSNDYIGTVTNGTIYSLNSELLT